MYYSAFTFICNNPTDKLCLPCRLLLHSHRDHLENPDGADYSLLIHSFINFSNIIQKNLIYLTAFSAE